MLGQGYYTDYDKYARRIRDSNFSYVTGAAIGGSRQYPSVNVKAAETTSREAKSHEEEFQEMVNTKSSLKPAYHHFKFSFCSSTAPYTSGKSGPYGWTVDRQRSMNSALQRLSRETGTVSELDVTESVYGAVPLESGTIEGVNSFLPYADASASGLGYGTAHDKHFRYTSSSRKPRLATRFYDQENSQVKFIPSYDKRRPHVLPPPPQSRNEVSERTLNVAAGLGYGEKSRPYNAYVLLKK